LEDFDLRAELVTIKDKLEHCINFLEQWELAFDDNLTLLRENRIVIGSIIQELDIKKSPSD